MESAFKIESPENWNIETVSDDAILGGGESTFIPNIPPPVQEIPQQQAAPQYNQAIPGMQGAPQTKINLGNSLPAEFVIGAGDKIISSLGVMIAGFFDISITKKDIALTASEKSDLEEPMQNYLNTQNITLSPGEGLLLAIGGIYVGKIITIAGMERQPKKKKNSDGIPDLNNLGDEPKAKRTYKPRVKK
jgi:hypothetical protein